MSSATDWCLGTKEKGNKRKHLQLADAFFLSVMDVEPFADGTLLEAATLKVVPRCMVSLSFLHTPNSRGRFHEIEGDGTVDSHLNIGNRLRHQILSISISIIERRCRIGVVGKARVNHQCFRIGIRIYRRAQILTVQMPLIDPLAIVFTIVFFIPSHIVLTISLRVIVCVTV